MGDALGHAIVPGVAGAYILGLPLIAGAFFAGGLATACMYILNQKTRLKTDAIIGLIFTSFFGVGLFLVSISPVPIDVQRIINGNILTISPGDTRQLVLISLITLLILGLKWKDLMVIFFDEVHAHSIGLRPARLQFLFLALLAAACVAALQTVGAFLVVALVITPGATAYLLSDRFPHIVLIAVLSGMITSALGAYISYFLDGATGGIIVCLQTLLFLLAFVFAPKRGWLAKRRERLAS